MHDATKRWCSETLNPIFGSGKLEISSWWGVTPQALLHSHNVQDIEKKDYYLHIDATIQPPFPVMIPIVRKEPVVIDLEELEHSVIDLVTPSPPESPRCISLEDDDDLYM